jgi:hypothetical protein
MIPELAHQLRTNLLPLNAPDRRIQVFPEDAVNNPNYFDVGS